MSWVSLSLATVAVGAWIGTWTSLNQGILHTRPDFSIIVTFVCAALATALVAQGKGRVWAVGAAFILPFWWFMFLHSWI
jgi:hypothetical protein